MNHAINLSRPEIIFVSPSNLGKISELVKKIPFVKQIIIFDGETIDRSLNSSALFFTRITESTKEPNLSEFQCEPQNMKENVALIMCSSGTTGLPKGVQLTQFNMFVGNFQLKYVTSTVKQIPTDF